MALKVFAIVVKPGVSFLQSEGLNALTDNVAAVVVNVEDVLAGLVTAETELDTLVDAALVVPAIDADPASEAAVEAIRTEYAIQFAAVAADADAAVISLATADGSLPTADMVIQVDMTTVTTKTQLRAACAAFLKQVEESNLFGV